MQQATGNRQQATGNRQQTAGNMQQTTGNKQQATDSMQQTTGNKQQLYMWTGNSCTRGQATGNRQHNAICKNNLLRRLFQAWEGRSGPSLIPVSILGRLYGSVSFRAQLLAALRTANHAPPTPGRRACLVRVKQAWAAH